ncbi:trans-sialidase [Trypanosoma cruzi]|nr:trans-sialidase [Trypanosoma cruzi]
MSVLLSLLLGDAHEEGNWDRARIATAHSNGSGRNNSTHTRTHSRRRVAGSSGRRMEGRESEPSMLRHVFNSAVLFPLVLVRSLRGAARSERITSMNPVDLFAGTTRISPVK